MQGRVYEQLTLFPEASPASPSVWLASKRAKGTTVTYGLKCSELSENLRRVGSLVRTYLESCALPLPTLSRTWSARAITPSCLILKLRLSARRTDGNASRSSPTVTASVGKHGGSNQRDSSGRPGLQLWRTPIVNDAINSSLPPSQINRDSLTSQLMRTMYPTPTTGAGLCGGEHHNQVLKAKEQAGEITPEERRSMAAGTGGQLNPDWVEWLMGFPVGWTNL